MKTDTLKSLEAGDGLVFYYKTGRGPAICLVHGFAEDGSVWEPLLELEKNYTLIIPDLPGSGLSPLGKTEPSMEDFAGIILKILQAENIDHVILIGHSMGGYISLAFAEKYPQRLAGLGLFHSSAFADDEEKISTRKKAIKLMETHGALALLRTAIPALFYDKEKHRHKIDVMVKDAEKFSVTALCGYYRSMIKRKDRSNLLDTLAIPFMIIAGAYDTAIPLQASLQQTYKAPVTYMKVLKQSGHMGMIEESTKALQFLKQFLKDIR